MSTNEKHVLIVDDSQDIRNLLKIILESKGYSTHCSSNGEEALSSLNLGSRLPDVILLDLRMPVMSGYDFIMQQRKNLALKDIPIIVMSGDDDTSLTRAQADPENILRKPISMSSILEAVKKNTRLH